jgi:hypothetical protein
MTARPICKACRCDADSAELVMYDGICESCERKNWDRIRAWRGGGEDAVLDAFYRNFVTTIH